LVPVVSSLAVLVVNDLIFSKVPTQPLLHDESVLADVPGFASGRVIRNVDVDVPVVPQLVSDDGLPFDSMPAARFDGGDDRMRGWLLPSLRVGDSSRLNARSNEPSANCRRVDFQDLAAQARTQTLLDVEISHHFWSWIYAGT